MSQMPADKERSSRIKFGIVPIAHMNVFVCFVRTVLCCFIFPSADQELMACLF